MTRLIDADALKEQFNEIVGEYTVGEIISIIDNAPTVPQGDKNEMLEYLKVCLSQCDELKEKHRNIDDGLKQYHKRMAILFEGMGEAYYDLLNRFFKDEDVISVEFEKIKSEDEFKCCDCEYEEHYVNEAPCVECGVIHNNGYIMFKPKESEANND